MPSEKINGATDALIGDLERVMAEKTESATVALKSEVETLKYDNAVLKASGSVDTEALKDDAAMAVIDRISRHFGILGNS
jgi:predicted Zn-dependent protease with MMP-like domain